MQQVFFSQFLRRQCLERAFDAQANPVSERTPSSSLAVKIAAKRLAVQAVRSLADQACVG